MNVETKKDIKFISVFVIILTLALAYLSQASLAKYRKQATGKINAYIAHWNIKLNNQNVNNTTQQIITPTFPGNTYTNSGVLAPGTTGYFNITIDASDVDVDFNYELDFSDQTGNPLTDLRVQSYEIGGTTYPFSGNKIENTIIRNTQTTAIKVNVIWYDESDNNMNNQQDTSIPINNEKVTINVKIKFTQKKAT